MAYSVLLRLIQMAAAEALGDGTQNLRDNERVGYFINEQGFLDYDCTKVINRTMMTIGRRLHRQAPDEGVGVLMSSQSETVDSIATLRHEVVSAHHGLNMRDRAPVSVSPAQQQTGPKRRKSLTAEGLVVVTSADCGAEKKARSVQTRKAEKHGRQQTNGAHLQQKQRLLTSQPLQRSRTTCLL